MVDSINIPLSPRHLVSPKSHLERLIAIMSVCDQKTPRITPTIKLLSSQLQPPSWISHMPILVTHYNYIKTGAAWVFTKANARFCFLWFSNFSFFWKKKKAGCFNWTGFFFHDLFSTTFVKITNSFHCSRLGNTSTVTKPSRIGEFLERF